jgi:hypothetical protein
MDIIRKVHTFFDLFFLLDSYSQSIKLITLSNSCSISPSCSCSSCSDLNSSRLFPPFLPLIKYQAFSPSSLPFPSIDPRTFAAIRCNCCIDLGPRSFKLVRKCLFYIVMDVRTCFLPAATGFAVRGPGAAASGRAPKSARSVVLRGRRKVDQQKSVHIGHSIGEKSESLCEKVKRCQSIQ